MSCIDPKEIGKHQIIHEILGVNAGTGGGSLTIIDGYPTFEDGLRGNKILSIARNTFHAAKKGRSRNVYLQQVGAGVAGTKAAYRMPRDGTITAISVQNSKTNTFTLMIRKNNDVTNLASVPVVAELGAHDKLVNVNFVEGDQLQFYIDGLSNDPVAWIEVAWRF